MKVKPLRKDLREYILSYGLVGKWEKANGLFEEDSRYPSLHAEVFQITNHYKR